MDRLRAWIQAARPMAQANIALPLLAGQALAFLACKAFDAGLLAWCLLFGVLDQLYIVFANDVADESGDRDNETFNRFSGGSRVLADGLLTADDLRRGARAAAIGMLLVAIYVTVANHRPGALLGWVLAIGLLWAYSYPPLRLSYRGHGEALQGLGTGVVLPLFGYYLQCGTFEAFPWPALLPMFMIGFASNITTALPDQPSDAAEKKATYPVRMGAEAARRHSVQLLGVAILLTPLVLSGLPKWGLAAIEVPALLALAFNVRAIRDADATDHKRCERFVFFNGLAMAMVWLGWAIAAVVVGIGG